MIYRTSQLLWGKYYNQSPFQATTMFSPNGQPGRKMLRSFRPEKASSSANSQPFLTNNWILNCFLKKKKKLSTIIHLLSFSLFEWDRQVESQN